MFSCCGFYDISCRKHTYIPAFDVCVRLAIFAQKLVPTYQLLSFSPLSFTLGQSFIDPPTIITTTTPVSKDINELLNCLTTPNVAHTPPKVLIITRYVEYIYYLGQPSC